MPLPLRRLHHVAVIASDYRRSLQFYTDVLGLTLRAEHYRADRQSYKADLALGDTYVVELFSFPSPPPRPSHPEAAGLRHLAFEVDNIDDAVRHLETADAGIANFHLTSPASASPTSPSAPTLTPADGSSSSPTPTASPSNSTKKTNPKHPAGI